MKKTTFSRRLAFVMIGALVIGLTGCSEEYDDLITRVPITFEVADATGMFEALTIRGDMTGSDWPSYDMRDPDGDGIWTITVNHVAEGTYEWGISEDFSEVGLDLWLVDGDNPTFAVNEAGDVFDGDGNRLEQNLVSFEIPGPIGGMPSACMPISSARS